MAEKTTGTYVKAISSVIGLALFGIAVWVIAQEVDRMGWAALVHGIRAIPGRTLALVLGLTVAAYALLTAYDVLAFRYIGRKLARRRIMFAAFLGYSFSNSISMTPSMAVRYRLYSSWGLSGTEISKVFFFHYLSTWLGFLAVGGVIFLIEPTPISTSTFLTFEQRRWIGAAMLAGLAGYFAVAEAFKNGIHVRGIELKAPSTRVMITQILIATLDWALVGVIPYALIRWDGAPLHYFSFLSVFLLAQVFQIVSHVPGGIGVFEGTLLLLLKSHASPPALLGPLLVYRAIYTLLPLLVAAPALVIFEAKNRAGRSRRANPSR